MANWLHPQVNIFTEKDSTSQIQFNTKYHIGLINYNDSLKITDSKQAFKYTAIFQDGNLNINYTQYHSIINFIEPDYSFYMQNKYSETLIAYEKNKGIITTNLDVIKYSGINRFSGKLLFATNLFSYLTIKLGKSTSKVPFQLNLNYSDFVYQLNKIHTDHITDYYGIFLSGKFFKIDYIMEKDTWEIHSNVSSPSSIVLDTGKNNNFYLDGIIFLNNNTLAWRYYQNTSLTELNLLNNNNSPFIKINLFKYINDFFVLDYYYKQKKYSYNFSFISQKTDIFLSNRIYPEIINDDLETFFLNSANINERSNGYLQQIIFSIKVKYLQSKLFYPTIKFDWLKDKYNIDLDTKGYLIGIPTYTNKQTLNIIGKGAVNLRFDLNILINDWLITTSFSQHIPYKIDVLENVITDEEKQKDDSFVDILENVITDEKKQKDDRYGGGLLQVSIIRYFN